MCGRYDLNITAMEIAARFGLVPRVDGTNGKSGAGALSNLAGWQPRYNIAPGQDNPVIVSDKSGQNRLEMMRWGLVPAWSREPRVAYSTINARAETVASKPTFRKPLATQRCLVPATGYYEWARVDKRKQPYRIGLREDGVEGLDGILAFAGLYDVWEGPGGHELRSYAVVTTRANDALSAIHSRMPVILPGDAEGAWLDGDSDLDRLLSLLQPYPEELMTAYPVSSLVNDPMNDKRELIEPLRPAQLAA